jgi:hypothetical protein
MEETYGEARAGLKNAVFAETSRPAIFPSGKA